MIFKDVRWVLYWRMLVCGCDIEGCELVSRILKAVSL